MELQFASMRLRLFVVTVLIPLVNMRKLQELVLIAMSLGNQNNQYQFGLHRYQKPVLKQWVNKEKIMFSISEIVEQAKEAKVVLAKRWTAAAVSCCAVMSQGNILAMFSPKYLLTAAKTGILASVLIFVGMLVLKDKADEDYIKAAMIGVGVTAADFVSHPAHFWGEAVLTGAVAMGVAWCISKLMSKVCQCD
jgi:energy-converting hydrogenase Eha subunit B